MTRVRLTRGTVWQGAERFPGDVLEVSPSEARLLVDIHRQAVRIGDDATVAGLESRDPAPVAKRGRR